jgi:hypothetical protein
VLFRRLPTPNGAAVAFIESAHDHSTVQPESFNCAAAPPARSPGAAPSPSGRTTSTCAGSAPTSSRASCACTRTH